jgi:hypothetical protein
MANRNNQTTVSVRIPSARQIWAGLTVAVSETAKEFVKSTLDKMAKSKPRGRVYYSKRKGFHRASAPGQRPAIDTTTLYKAVAFKLERGALEATAFIKPTPNPENGARADRYAEILQNGMDRLIMTEKDAKEFEKVLLANVQKVANRIR